MKFLLIMTVCSSLYQICMEPREIYPMYDTYMDCMVSGYEKSLYLIKELGPRVEADRSTIHFQCKQMIGV